MKKTRKRLYEGMYIISATLSEDARAKALEKITKSIEEKQGEIHKIHEMGKMKLAYEIQNKKEGFYFLIYFSVDSSQIKEIWSEYHLNEDLLRFFTMRCDEVKQELKFKKFKQG